MERDVRLKNIKGDKGKYYMYFEDYLQELKEKSANEKIFYNEYLYWLFKNFQARLSTS